ncbi:hypothetical protein [Lysinibacillus sp. Y5S-8]|uniref:hypothetical protein n=1 Tax=Lysinibacillus sp. Y5S-8 TaxID=3122488 RepID=UPI0030D2CDD5
MDEIYTRFGIDAKDANGVIATRVYDIHKPLDLYYRLIGLELQDFTYYLDDMKLSVEKIKNEMLERDLDAFNFLLSNDYEYAHRIDIRYPYLLNNSVFISIYSLLEDVLYRFIEICKYRLKIEETLKENRKLPILTQYFNIIEKALNYKIPKNFKNDFSNYRKLRNCIVHKRGYITWMGESDKKLIKVVEDLSDKSIGLSENGKSFILGEEACNYFILEIEKMFKLLCEVLIKEETKKRSLSSSSKRYIT